MSVPAVLDFSVTDWEMRIRNRLSLIPKLPLVKSEVEDGMAFFDELRLSDVVGQPRLGDACGQWFREIAMVIAGSRDPKTNTRFVREILLMAPKGSSKTSYAAAAALMMLYLNVRPRAQIFVVAPSESTASVAFDAAKGMIEADPELINRFHVNNSDLEITDRLNSAKVCVKAFSLEIMTGPKPMAVFLDEIHLIGKHAKADKVMRQIRGGLQKNTESLLFMLTTQSDERPTGIFKEELTMARKIRDGKIKEGVRMLPILYEFPLDIATDEKKWSNPKNWSMVMPNLGLSLVLDDLISDYKTECEKGDEKKRLWASQHLNIEVGMGIRGEGWAASKFWVPRADNKLRDLRVMLDRCEVAVCGGDGGGLDDLFGGNVLGREHKTLRWLSWSMGWCREIVLERRQEIATKLRDFESEGTLRILPDDSTEDVEEFADIIERVKFAGLLPEKAAIGLDPSGVNDIVDELVRRKFTTFDPETDKGQIIGVRQGYTLQNAVKVTERRLAQGNLLHDGSSFMEWVVSNAKPEQKGNALMITKASAGVAKIDPLMALFNSVHLMSMNPEAQGANLDDFLDDPIYIRGGRQAARPSGSRGNPD